MKSHALTFFVLLLLLVSGSGCEQLFGPSFDELATQSKKLIDEGKPDAAERLLSPHLADVSPNEKNMVALAKLFFNRGCARYAIYTRDYSKGSVDGWYLAKTLGDFNRALEINQQHAGAYTFRGILHEMYGMHEHAMADLSMGIKLDPNETAAYYSRAALYKELKNYDAALADYEQYLSRVKDDTWRKNVEKSIEEIAALKKGGPDK